MNKLKSLTLIAMLAIPLVSQAQWPQWYGGVGAGWQHNVLKTDMNNIYLQNTFTSYQFNNTKNSEFTNLFFGLANQKNRNYWAIEADAYYDNTHNDSGFYEPFSQTTHNLLSQMPWRYELDGIYGRYFKPNTLGYAKLGLTTGQLKASYYAYTPDGTVTGNTQANKQLYGGVFGLGVQYALNKNWRLGAEADYVQFFNATAQTSTVYRNFTPNNDESFNYKDNIFLLKAYISYYF